MTVVTLAERTSARQGFPVDPLPGVLLGGSVNLLAGPSGVGKTTLTAWMLTRFRDALPIFGHQPAPIPKIAVITADRSWQQSGVRWFDAVGYGDVDQYCFHDDPTFKASRLRNRNGRTRLLGEFLARLDPLPRGSLVLVDPLSIFLGGNLLDYDICMVAAAEIRGICRERGITLIGTAHAAKQKSDRRSRYTRLQDRIMGTTGLLGFSDTCMYLAGPDETGTPAYTFLWVPHHLPAQSFRLSRGADGLFIPYDDGDELQEAQRIVALVPFAPETLGFADLILAAAELTPPISRTTLYRRLQELLQSGAILKPDHGRYARVLVQ